MTSSYLLLPAIVTLLWALRVKIQQQEFSDVLLLVVNAIAISSNIFLVYQMMLGEISVGLHLVQMTAASMVVPLGYLYFSRHTSGMASSSKMTNITLWMLVLFSYVPQIIITNPFEPFIVPESGLHPFAFYVLSHGQKLVAIYMGDLVVILQSVAVFIRAIFFLFTLREYKLHLKHGMFFFAAYWIIAAIMAVLLSLMDNSALRSPAAECFYFGIYGIMLSMFNVLIIKGCDLCPLETEQGEDVENFEVFVRHQYSELASRLRILMEEQQLYTDSQLTAERVTELLNTNHTYFSQMMAAEWGMTFSDYLGQLRMAQVEKLLADNRLNISQVAMQSGFADAGYMSKKFKAKHGITPSEWRRCIQKSTKN